LGSVALEDDTQSSNHLSPRERQVADLMIKGFSNKEIADALFIAEATAKVHIRHIFDKLHAHSRVEATTRLLAFRQE
jgi:DNA-binding NarL/FixJ family response regulator